MTTADEYTPTTEEVRARYNADEFGYSAALDDPCPEFDRWLATVKASAWEEGRKFGYQDAQAHHGSGVEGAGCGPDSWDCTCQNPYRADGGTVT